MLGLYTFIFFVFVFVIVITNAIAMNAFRTFGNITKFGYEERWVVKGFQVDMFVLEIIINIIVLFINIYSQNSIQLASIYSLSSSS